MCRSAVNDGSCSPWVMCSCSVVRGNQIRDSCHCGTIDSDNTCPGLLKYWLGVCDIK